MAIYFFHPNKQYGFLSNFSSHSIEMDGYEWSTVEHYYQAQKFSDERIKQDILKAKTPDKAKHIGHNMKHHVRSNWDLEKYNVMKCAVMKKFETHSDIRKLLAATGDEELIENSKSDFYWGCGWNRTGENRLGEILMEIRTRLHVKD